MDITVHPLFAWRQGIPMNETPFVARNSVLPDTEQQVPRFVSFSKTIDEDETGNPQRMHF